MAVSGTINNVRVSGIACAVPETVVTNEAFLGRFGEEQMQKFEKMVGVRERRVSRPDQTSSDFACRAAKVLEDKGLWSKDDVDALIFVSQTPDYALPATACVLQHRLGIKKDCIAYDVNLGCSGFVYGFFIASSMLQMPGVSKVLFVGGDCSTKPISPFDPSAAPLFGDSGFACVLQKDPSASKVDYAYCTDGNGFKAIIQPGVTYAGRMPIRRDDDGKTDAGSLTCRGEAVRAPGELLMDGMDVFNFTINEVPDLIKERLRASSLAESDIDLLILHQANKYVLKQISMITGFSMKKIPLSMDRYGNTSVTSIPLTLCDYAQRTGEQGVKKCLMSGFGVGLSWGSMVTDFDFSKCFGIVDGCKSFNEGVVV